MQNIATKKLPIQAWNVAVDSVGGERVVRGVFFDDGVESVSHLLAVGKAGCAMFVGGLDCLARDGRGLVVTKYGHCDASVTDDSRVTVIESGHPLPDENSLRGGRAVCDFVRSVPRDGRLVMLVSGGASALLESLVDGVDLAALQEVTSALLAGGYDISVINAVRSRLSVIKGGKLLRRFRGESVFVYAISDVPGDDINLIGGGIGSINSPSVATDALPAKIKNIIAKYGDEVCDEVETKFIYRAKIIGCNRIARDAAAKFFRAQKIPVIVNQESLHKDIHAAAQSITAALLDGAPGAYIWGGEPTVVLPPKPGVGGRNQSLALAVAEGIRGRRGISVLVAGTDGTDGPTNAAGALVDGDTFSAASGASSALQKADAGTYFARIAALYKPGPTGTNVMDLAIAVKE